MVFLWGWYNLGDSRDWYRCEEFWFLEFVNVFTGNGRKAEDNENKKKDEKFYLKRCREPSVTLNHFDITI